MRTANPALRNNSFGGFVDADEAHVRRDGARVAPAAMTIQGTVNKTTILLAILVACAIIPWKLFFADQPTDVLPLMIVGLIGGTVCALVTIFARSWAPVMAPLYAACEGVTLGALSAIFERRYPGIAFQAFVLTLGVLAVMLIIYKTRAIRVTEKFKMGMVAATGAIALAYLFSIVMSLLGMPLAFMHSSGWLGIGISLVVVVVAALNLVLDFDFIEQGAARGAPRYMEWYGAFGLLLTLVWLYLEMLRLLSRLARR